MARRILAGGLTLLLSLALAAPASEAQSTRDWNRSAVPGGVIVTPPAQTPGGPAPAIRSTPQLPPYYLDPGGPVTAPKAPVGPNEVAASLRARGFRDIAPVQQRGNTMIVPHATGPSGERVQLVIGPRGEIVGVRVLGR